MKKRERGIDLVRVIAAFGIVAMHVLLLGDYTINTFMYNMIKPLSALIKLFFIISGFSNCCGYYEKAKENLMDWTQFYISRYKKILPTFAIVVMIEAVFSWRFPDTLYEIIGDFSLLFSFMTNKSLDLASLGWTLGVIFGFYFFFPWFVSINKSKRQSLFVLLFFYILHLAVAYYFIEPGFKNNVILWLYQFEIGAIIYFYKEEILKRSTIIRYITVFITIAYFVLRGLDLWAYEELNCVIFAFWVMSAIGCKSKIVNSKGILKLSSLSLSIYLVQMIVFRPLQKLNIIHIFSIDLLDYVITIIVTFLGCIILSECIQYFIKIMSRMLHSIACKGDVV